MSVRSTVSPGGFFRRTSGSIGQGHTVLSGCLKCTPGLLPAALLCWLGRRHCHQCIRFVVDVLLMLLLKDWQPIQGGVLGLWTFALRQDVTHDH